MSTDPFRKVWHEEYRREVQDVLSGLRGETSKSPADPLSMTEAVIPPARVFQELKASREKLADLLPLVEDLRHRLDLAGRRLEEEMHRREKLKDVIIRLNFNARKLESDLHDSKSRFDAGMGRFEEVSRKLRDSEAARQDLADALERAGVHEAQFKGTLQSLRLKADELQASIESRDIEIQSLKKRYEAACLQHAAQLAERESEIESALRRAADKQAQLERAMAERDGHAASSLAAKTELGQRLAEVSRLTVELQGMKEALRTEREAHAQVKASWDAEIERRRDAEAQIREAAHQMELEREAASARMAAFEADRERFRVQAHEAIQKAESESLRAHAVLEESRRFEADCAAMFRKQMEELQEERRRFYEAQRKDLAQAQDVKDQGLAALEAARKREDENAREEEAARRALEAQMAKLQAEAQALRERAVDAEQRALASAEAERARLKAEYEAVMERGGRDAEASRQALEAQMAKLQAEAQALRERAVDAEQRALASAEAERARLKGGGRRAVPQGRR
ncbi:MAG: hypothetical protein HY748_10730 [Elusimicrobia bacterium]|nr:hypothetical protein [Elusimicrobiota bacterium]